MRDHQANRGAGRLAAAAPLALLAAIAYVPVLATEPGRVAADTKAYLYLDPGRLLASAVSMWNPAVAGGGVTHQNIGYLLPQGPFYWVLAQLGVPVWVAQRLWLGTLLFAAGAGAWYLARVLGLRVPGLRVPGLRVPGLRVPGLRVPGLRAGGAGAARAAGEVGPLVAGLVYLTSPYFLQDAQRISALLLPWCGLGWMLAFTVLALRRGGWRYPALFGLVVALVGGTNATALLYVGLAPALYLLYAVFVTREADWRRALALVGRLGAISVAVSLWWVAALLVEGAYGIDVLKYTETLPAIASASSPAEVLRGLGYWFFYGTDVLGPWLHAAAQYETRPWLIAASFAVPLLAFAAALAVRWSHRAFFVALVLVGLVLGVGAYPYADPGLVGRGLRGFMSGTTAGFALRSTDRATPLVVLGLAMLLGAAASALARRARPAGLVAGVLAGGLALANAIPLLTGGAVEAKYTRPSQLPAYLQQAAAYLDAGGNATRVLLEPGENSASYLFGDTNDSIWPGLLTRPTIERQQLIAGGYPADDLLEALDLSLQQGTFEPASLAPVARLLSAGDVVLQSEQAWWWFGTPRPRETWPLFERPPPGLARPVRFGPPVGDDAPASLSDVDGATLALPAGAPDPPALAVYGVSDARPVYRAEPASAPLVVDGSGAGIVAAAATGLLDDNPTVVYAGSLDGDPAFAREALTPAASLLLTDSNALVAQRWTSVRDNVGQLETEPPAPTAPDPSAVPLVLFPGAPPDAYTHAVYLGARYVTASSYGGPYAFAPEVRPAAAFDGLTSTSWVVDSFSAADLPWLEVALEQPVTADHVDLVQARTARTITGVTLTFDGGRPVAATLVPASRGKAGQVVSFPARRFRTLRITVDGVSGPSGKSFGLSEVRVPGVSVRELTVLPGDLLSLVGAASQGHRLTIVLTRDRVGSPSPRSDPEVAMARELTLPAARTFTISGTVRIGTGDPDQLVDELLGGPDALGGVVVRASSRLPGDLDARGLAAFDGNPATAWMPDLGGNHQQAATVELELRHAVTFDHLDLRVVADGRHSVPTSLRIRTDTGADVTVPVPPIAGSPEPGATVLVPLRFPEVSGRQLHFTIASYRPVRTHDYASGGTIVLPLGIAEIGVPGVRVVPENPAAALPDVCRSDLLRADGRPVPVRVEGTVGAAEAGTGLRLVGCGSAAGGLTLGAGSHLLETSRGAVAGLQIDRLVLDSAAGGGPMPLGAGGTVPPAPGTVASPGSPALPAPAVKVLASSSTGARLEVTGAGGPFWLVLGESQDRGWTAAVEGGASLGPSQLVDAMSNGWYVTPPAGGGPFYVDLSFTPQTGIWAALAVSAGALVACLGLALWPRRRRRSRRRRRRSVLGRFGAARARQDDPESAAGAGAREPGRDTGPGDPQRDPGPAGGAGTPPAPPELENPLAPAAAGRPRPLVVVLAALAAGALAAALPPPPAGPFVGAGAALATAAALTWSRGRIVLRLAAVGCVAAVLGDVALGEAVRHLRPGTSWPSSFPGTTTLTWVAVIALALDAAVELARRARPPSGSAGAAAPGST